MNGDYSKMQDGDELRRFFSESAEKGYRPRPCHNCGRHRMSVCNDGRLRCEKCHLDEPATELDLADVFGTLEKYLKKLEG